MSHADAGATLQLPIDDPSQVGQARRVASALARSQGLDEERVGRCGIIATELATNLLRHAREGQLLVRSAVPGEQRPAVELLALDRGPGMEDLERCLRDGYSSGGTAGTGLGAVRRLADDFDIASRPGSGTAVLARLRSGTTQPGPSLRLGAVCVAMGGEAVCGDAWAWRREAAGASLLVFDGLGHGILAAEAANAARAAFLQQPSGDPGDLLRAIHASVSGTRGGAAAVVQVDTAAGRLRYAGIGNIAGTLLGSERRRGLPSHNGIVGASALRVQCFDYDWGSEDMLVMHSDGLVSRWSLDDLPGAAHRDPALVAGWLYRDFCRGRDDAAVAVVAQA